MVNYRRNKPQTPDAVYFITIVTHRRQRLFSSHDVRELAKNEMKRISTDFGVIFKAWVILPDHIHWLICPVDSDYSKVISSFKRGVGLELKRNGQIKTGEKIWLERFWEHTVKDQDDYNRCVDYINFNSVKHNYVLRPEDWEHSSYNEYVKRGIYDSEHRFQAYNDICGTEYD